MPMDVSAYLQGWGSDRVIAFRNCIGLREISSKGMAGEHREMPNAWRLSSLGWLVPSGHFCFAGHAMYGEEISRISSA